MNYDLETDLRTIATFRPGRTFRHKERSVIFKPDPLPGDCQKLENTKWEWCEELDTGWGDIVQVWTNDETGNGIIHRVRYFSNILGWSEIWITDNGEWDAFKKIIPHFE